MARDISKWTPNVRGKNIRDEIYYTGCICLAQTENIHEKVMDYVADDVLATCRKLERMGCEINDQWGYPVSLFPQQVFACGHDSDVCLEEGVVTTPHGESVKLPWVSVYCRQCKVNEINFWSNYADDQIEC